MIVRSYRYRVYLVHNVTSKQRMQFLRKLADERPEQVVEQLLVQEHKCAQVDIFRVASRRSQDADVLVAPDYQMQFERLLTVNGYHFNITVEDMQR